ncbi:MAG TPA: M20 family metallopeptidase [Thermodesulfobacteriota bacterium]
MTASSAIPVASEELTAFLQALVRVPSVNPPGGEGPVAALVAAKLRDLGFDVRVVEAEPGRPNVIAHKGGTGRGPTLLFNGHMDVQPAASGWTRDPFGAEIEGSRLYGRGSVDMKAGLAAMVFAADALERAGIRLAGDLVITAVADEVSGGHKGTGFLVRERLVSADMAVIGEPTGEQVNVCHRGALWVEIEVVGKSAHGGRPWLGVNAVSKMAKLIRAIESDLLPGLQSRTHPLVPPPTINFGTIAGGTKFNLVADRCVLQLDRRLVPGESIDSALREIEATCAAVRAADPEAWSYEVREVMRVTPGEISPDAPIVRACQRAFREVTGREAGIGATAGFEDAHFLLDAGIPTAMFGPYRRKEEDPAGRPFFTTSGMADEFVDLRDVVTGAQVYARLALNLLG